jgi:hypothetical protein
MPTIADVTTIGPTIGVGAVCAAADHVSPDATMKTHVEFNKRYMIVFSEILKWILRSFPADRLLILENPVLEKKLLASAH